MRIETVLSKYVSVPAALAALLSLSGCSNGNGADASKHEANDTPAASAGAAVKSAADVADDADGAPASPRLGGNVASVGDYQVELVVHHNGLVRGLVFDAQGKPYTEREELELAVTLNTPGGTRPRLALAWNGAAACFEGRTAAELVAAPIDISLGVAGSAHAGTLSDYALLPDAQFGGNVLAAGAYGVELVTRADRVTAFVFDAAGSPQARGDLQLRLKLGAGAGKSLDLKWDPALKGYAAKLDAALDLGSPLALELNTGGALHVGGAPSLRALGNANLGAQVKAEAKLDVPVPDVKAKLQAGTKALVRAKGKLGSGVHAVSKAKVSAKAKVSSALRVPKPSANLDVKASSKGSTKTGASAGVKAKAGFNLK